MSETVDRRGFGLGNNDEGDKGGTGRSLKAELGTEEERQRERDRESE